MNALEKVKQLLATPESPALGSETRAGTSSPAQIQEAFGKIFSAAAVPPANRELARALVLLWHDQLEPAHVIAQEFENRDGSFIHGIMHRREPDYSNAKYWFRRAGAHPCFPEIARRVSARLDASEASGLRERLLPRGEWDPVTFTDACEQASRKPPADKEQRLLREIQRIEMETLLEYLLPA